MIKHFSAANNSFNETLVQVFSVGIFKHRDIKLNLTL